MSAESAESFTENTESTEEEQRKELIKSLYGLYVDGMMDLAVQTFGKERSTKIFSDAADNFFEYRWLNISDPDWVVASEYLRERSSNYQQCCVVLESLNDSMTIEELEIFDNRFISSAWYSEFVALMTPMVTLNSEE